MDWRIHHKSVTDSTNIDARAGRHGDVFTADFQTCGRGRLDHKWLSAPGENLIMSVVLDVDGVPPDEAATLPLVVGLAVADGLRGIAQSDLALKWPNDILADSKKLSGILCERHGDCVVAGIGVNVNQTEFSAEIAARATSLAVLCGGRDTIDVACIRDSVLQVLASRYGEWRERGFASLLPEIARIDALKGRWVSIMQTDADESPVTGVCGGIAEDGSLLVGGARIYAGEAHVGTVA